ncbi:hypothetical protein [Vibrio comitans]|uniref:Uncharacterized protein n=1 Tax=Vibrio comitans NBRC 102076 TaxID=1219078 RepID=A0A4Y3II48_9VIBR|nr:hypothetical protein [Vibrio comitans]GEA59199.1 hypothetical protein VCO01S_03920 [Vibrio comitans NBRC 102076]
MIHIIKQTAKRSLSTVVAPIILSCSFNVLAEENSQFQPELKGKQIFKHYGIDDDLPKLGISSLDMGEHLVEQIDRTIYLGDEERKSSVYLVKSTDQKGNIDLRIKHERSQLDDHVDAIEEIEKSTRTQYRLRNWAQSYDPASVRATELDNGDVNVSFNYSKYGLPQDIAYFRFMSVEVLISDGKPQTMQISNTTPFKLDGYSIEEYRQVITFQQLESGKLIMIEKSVEMNGKKRKKPVRIVESIVPIALYDEEGVNIIDEARLTEASDPRLIEERVEVNRTFPLMGDMVARQGIDLPLPFGISMAYRNQDMNIPTNDFVIGGIRLNDFFDPTDTFANVNAEVLTLRGDVNILPFWNMFGYVGKINVDANVDAGYTGAAGEKIQEMLNNKAPGLGDEFCDALTAICQPGRLNVPLNLKYDLVGIGTTLSVGYKEFFASVTGTYSTTRMEGSSSWGDGLITVQPMLGYQLVDYRAQFFVGAEYQGLKSRMQGRVITGDIEFDYDVGVELNEWAALVGVNKQFGKHYQMSLLYNKGETRDSMTLNFGYRF